MPAEQQAEPQLLDLAYDTRPAAVATNECYFAAPDDYEAHDALLCIAGGRYVVEDDRRRADARALFQERRRDGDGVRRSARGAGQHRRDRQALRLPAEGPQADPAELRRPTDGRQRRGPAAGRSRRAEARRPRRA